MLIEQLKEALADQAIPQKAAFLPGFFKAVPGGYGEGDRFLGVIVPAQRKLAKSVYQEISLPEVSELLMDEYHEVRLTALFMLVYKYQKAKQIMEQEKLVDFYLSHLDFVNNWDLVDSSCYQILGHYYFQRDKSIFYKLASSESLWKQRIAIISSFYWIKQGEFMDALRLCETLLHHEHDLLHKAVGWMLREIGNRDFEVEIFFLRQHYSTMPRMALRYAIEKFEPDLRQQILKGAF